MHTSLHIRVSMSLWCQGDNGTQKCLMRKRDGSYHSFSMTSTPGKWKHCSLVSPKIRIQWWRFVQKDYVQICLLYFIMVTKSLASIFHALWFNVFFIPLSEFVVFMHISVHTTYIPYIVTAAVYFHRSWLSPGSHCPSIHATWSSDKEGPFKDCQDSHRKCILPLSVVFDTIATSWQILCV